MGKESRRYAKRKARQVYRRMDNVMRGLIELAEMYQKDAPEEVFVLTALIKGTAMYQDNFSDWYAHVWGSPPSDWYSDA